MTASSPAIQVPHALKRGALKPDEERYIDSGSHLLRRMPVWLGMEDLSTSEILDIGCGTKFTQAILRDDIAVGRYVGIDIFKPMIEHLNAEVTDPRFSYYHMNTHNAMYNPDGETLTGTTALPCGDERFDIICMFSVFTHLAPHDYRALLQVVRPYIRPGGRLLFSLFLDESSVGGHGLIDDIMQKYGSDHWQPSGEPFRDAYPGKPLHWALYSREHALELIANTGWQVDSVNDPEPHIQHFIICSPD